MCGDIRGVLQTRLEKLCRLYPAGMNYLTSMHTAAGSVLQSQYLGICLSKPIRAGNLSETSERLLRLLRRTQGTPDILAVEAPPSILRVPPWGVLRLRALVSRSPSAQ